MSEKFYITPTIPYVNAEPHIGFALEIVQTDVIARYQRLYGKKVFFNAGTDEHGLKIYRKALEEKKEPQDYVDEYAAKFDRLKGALNLSYDNFVRTTDAHHKKAAQEFWKRCDKNGDIYKKDYKIKYCVGCELEKTDSELEKDRCPVHPNQSLEIIEEENYFFKFSKYEDELLKFYEKNPEFVVPEYRFTEIKNFVKKGLQDFSISRLKSKMPWGVDVPGDPKHVMYVWFDALVNYISSIGWPEKEDFDGFWPGVQVAGKDNLRQQSAIWQAMLMSAGLPNTKQILIHGFLTKDGKKISKSLGNTVDPIALAKKYGTEAVRYYLLAKVHPFNDSDFTYKSFKEVYNADLANGLGNLMARIETMAAKNQLNLDQLSKNPLKKPNNEIDGFMQKYRFDLALNYIWKWIHGLDKYIDQKKPWEKSKDEANKILGKIVVGTEAINGIKEIAQALLPFLPDTAEEIIKRFSGQRVEKPGKSLFPRL